MHESLSTNVFCLRRHLTSDSTCKSLDSNSDESDAQPQEQQRHADDKSFLSEDASDDDDFE
ncbi:hypothetical protein TSUD_340720 [Trifolium subterraneum]|uniref:Uncharacterized protein n=1 Tax=Trifolium subterraneum TaxID=3900 RepID=A0A2Z6MHD3_TRISU|nr:hypothetical protein TSUD_340720 [Trifolium subterraneum]